MKSVLCGGAVFAASLVVACAAWANHPVLLEGNCDAPVPGTTIIPLGTCGDYDGDGRIGTAEDTDGADRIFGTLNAALGPGTGAAAGTGANMNGMIIIVASGRFAEVANIGSTYLPPIAAPGNVTIKAAPGVEAIIDAVLQGDPAGGNTARQNGAGIIVNMPADRRVILENLTIRNFAIGVYVGGASNVSIVNCRVTNNLNYGVLVQGTAEVSIDRSKINHNGFRIGVGVSTTASPGAGVVFQSSSSGAVFRSEIVGNASSGLADESSGETQVQDAYFFDNNPNF